MKLSKLWTADLKNGIFGGLFPTIDPFNENWFYVGDGWGSAFPSMKLRKFDLSTGQEIQSAYTKNNVRCLNFDTNQKDLFVVTNNKIIKLDRIAFDMVQKFEKGIQRFNDYVESDNKDILLMMNYRMESLFIYNHKTEQGRKKKIGSCCGIFKQSDNEYLIFDGYHGRVVVYNLGSNSITEVFKTDVFYSSCLTGNVAFLRLGYGEYDAGNCWQIKPTSKIRMVDLQTSHYQDFETRIDFHSFSVDGRTVYLWGKSNIWLYSLDTKGIISKGAIGSDQYVMRVFPKHGKVLAESYNDKVKALYCYDFQI